tara:strand:+ start:2527 stop:2886 length:360 start_codon:yes stop_codon:yes gene_type:complete
MTRRRFKKQSRKRRKYRKKSTKKKRRHRRKSTKKKRRRTRRKRGGTFYSMKLKNFPSKYETILADITPGNTDLLQKIASSLGNKWLCNHPAVKNHLEGLAADTQLEATRISCSTASYTH